MNDPQPRTLLLSVLLLAAPAGAQAVHVVDQAAGPGTDFTTFAAAVAAAADGDLLLARPGVYPEPVVLDGKGLSIQAVPGARVQVEGIFVRNLTSRQAATVAGLHTLAFCDLGFLYEWKTSLEIVDNHGPVTLQDLDVEAQALLRDSKHVALSDCRFNEPRLPQYIAAGEHVPMLHVERSRVALFRCGVWGWDGVDHATPDGGDALSLLDAEVWSSGCTYAGGEGEDEGACYDPGDGGTGVRVDGVSRLTGQDDQVRGGTRGWASGFCGTSHDGVAIELVAGTLTLLDEPVRTLSASELVDTGAPTTLDYTGEPGDLVFLLVASTPARARTLPGLIGPLFLPADALVLKIGRADAVGHLARTVAAPLVPTGARAFHLQPVAIEPLGAAVAGTPAVLHVLGASY